MSDLLHGVDTHREPKTCRRKICFSDATTIITVRINGNWITDVGSCAAHARSVITEIQDQYHGCSISTKGRRP